MTSAISQLVYMPNFRAIGQSVWEKNGNRQTETQKDRKTDALEFYKDRYNQKQGGTILDLLAGKTHP